MERGEADKRQRRGRAECTQQTRAQQDTSASESDVATQRDKTRETQHTQSEELDPEALFSSRLHTPASYAPHRNTRHAPAVTFERRWRANTPSLCCADSLGQPHHGAVEPVLLVASHAGGTRRVPALRARPARRHADTAATAGQVDHAALQRRPGRRLCLHGSR
jgi:hypothetical protein